MRPRTRELREAIRTILLGRESQIVNGVEVWGLAEGLHQVATTPFAFPVTGLPFTRIAISEWHRQESSANIAAGWQYEVLIEVATYAKNTNGEEQPYLHHYEAFDLMIQQMIEVLLEPVNICDGTYCFQISDNVTVNDESGVVTTDEGYEAPAFYYRIILEAGDC